MPHTEHPHGLTDGELEALFTPDKPVIFNFHSLFIGNCTRTHKTSPKGAYLSDIRSYVKALFYYNCTRVRSCLLPFSCFLFK